MTIEEYVKAMNLVPDTTNHVHDFTILAIANQQALKAIQGAWEAYNDGGHTPELLGNLEEALDRTFRRCNV